MRFLKGFLYAGRGLALAARERNFRFQLCAAAFVVFFAAKFYDLSRGEWALLFLTCGTVLALEAVNTSVERLCDKLSPDLDPKIGAVKDIAAGAVLAAAVAAAAVGVCLFFDTERLAEIAGYFSDLPRLAALLLALAAAWCLVFLPKTKK